MKKDKSDILFLILARLNSERVPQKMIKPFAGTSLLNVSINKMIDCESIPKENIYLAAHEEELLEVGKDAGINIYKRSYESSIEEDNLKILYDWHIDLGKSFKYYMMINPCCPLLKTGTIDEFVESYVESDSDGMFGVVEKRNMIWDDKLQPFEKRKNNSSINTKNLSVIYEAAHCLYAGRIDRLADGIHMGTFEKPDDPELFIMKDGLELFDIDYPWQFDCAELLYEHRERLML